MAAEFKIGRLRYTWRGAWETGKFFNRDAVVSNQGKTYVCLVPHTAGNFFNDLVHYDNVAGLNPYWSLMVDGTSWKGEWAPITEYTVGNIVAYGGSLYKRTTNAPSGLTFNPANWEIYVTINSTWTGDFLPNTLYKEGENAKYGGNVFRCISSYTSNSTGILDYTKWEIAYEGIEFKGEWNSAGATYKPKDIVKYGPDLWICNVDHESELPFDSPTTWTIWLPGIEFGSTWNNTIIYQLGDTVLYGGYSYVNKTVNNVGHNPSTSSSNWDLLTTGYSVKNEWTGSVEYKIGSVVRRSGNLYVAVQDSNGEDPTNALITTTYSAAGSSGITLKVASTIGIYAGMIISGTAFKKGQYVTKVEDLTTLTISQPPYSTIQNSDGLDFIGVNGSYWIPVFTGARWKNRWNSGQSYIINDIIVWVNKTYKCIKTHNSTGTNRPDLDVNNTVWIRYLDHDRFNVLNIAGDLILNIDGINQALAIGTEGFLLKSISGVPTWSNVFRTPNVYYVKPDGTDAITSGLTWDNPYKSIKYACAQILAGTENPAAKSLFSANRNFLLAEIVQWQTYQQVNNISPFASNVSIDNLRTRRDSSYLIDAIIYDLIRGSNSQVIAFTLSFFDKEFNYKFATPEVENQIAYFIASLNRLFDLIIDVAQSNTINLYQIINGVASPITQTFGTPLDAQVITDIQSFKSIIITALTDGNTVSIPRENQGVTSTVMVKTGTYYEELPIVVPANTALNGDELRGVVVRPKLVIDRLVTRSTTGVNRFTVPSTVGMTNGMAVQFDSTNSVNGINSIFGGVQRGVTYYIVGTVTPTQFSVSLTLTGQAIPLSNNIGQMYVYAGDALKDMFYCQNGTGIRNMTLTGLLGTLTDANEYLTRRPTGGAYVSLDPGVGPDDTSAWIYRRSPYIQNVSTFGQGATGLKIDGTLHNGGNKSIVCNDFTQIISDGIGVWCTGPDALCEAVSVFSYYAYAGYFAENGGRMRATNGNSSYGTFGVIAEGFNANETPSTGNINNRYYEATATPFSSLGAQAEILKLQFSHAGEHYFTQTTNLLKNSNTFTGANWTSDNNVTLIQSIISPYAVSEAWIASGTTSGTNSSYIYQNITIAPSGQQYTGISGLNYGGGGGSAATFDITVTSTAYIVAVNNGGSGYVSTNQILILGSQLGGLDNINDLLLTVDTLISGTSINTVTHEGTVPAGSLQKYTASIFCKKGSSNVIDLIGTFSGYSTASSYVSYNFNTGIVTPGNITGGYVPIVYSATPVSNSDKWFRLSFEFYDVSGLNNALQIRLYPRGQSGNAAYTLIYGAQLQLGNGLKFYQKTNLGQYSAYANIDVIGAGSGVEVVADEVRSQGVYQTRLLEVNSITGGRNYLSSSNNGQTGDLSSITIAASDVAGSKEYLGMRLFVNSGTGAGQYGTISYFDTTSKIATMLKESFDQITITETETGTNTFIIGETDDINTLYVDQPIQFTTTTFVTPITQISQSTITVTGTTGGVINVLTVGSTARLAVDMPITFSGVTSGGVTSNFTYYITSIIDGQTLQVSTTIGGPVVLLTTAGSTMQLNYPDGTSYIHGSTDNMDVNLPIYFTGTEVSDIVAGTTYYINTILSGSEFTISASLITPVATNTTAITNLVTVDTTTGLVSLNPIKFTGTTFGGISTGIVYYINHIPNSGSITLATQILSTRASISAGTSNLVSAQNTSGFVIGNPIVFTGTTFGGIENNRVYYVAYVNDVSTFSISASSTELTLTITQSTDGLTLPDRLTTTSTNNMTPLNPIKFYGATFGGINAPQTYYINRIFTDNTTTFNVSDNIISTTATETFQTSNLITVTSTVGMVPNNPIIFAGNTFGGIESGRVYYVSAVNSATDLTISTSVSGSVLPLTPATGNVTVRTTSVATSLTSSSGTMTAITRFTGTPITLIDGVGDCIVRTTDQSITLTSGTGTLQGTTTSAKLLLASDTGSMKGNFSVPLIGGSGISAGTTYYVKTITPGANVNKFTVTASPGGLSDVVLINEVGSMKMGELGWDHVNPGTDLVASFDSTSVYSIEPRIVYSKSPFTATSALTVPQAPGTAYIDIAYGNGKFIALPDAGNIIAISTGANAVNQATLPSSAAWKSITYGNGFWIIISSAGSAPGSKVLYSNSDGVTWKTASLPSIANWSKVIYGNGKFVAITSNGTTAAYSSNFGATWVAATGFNGGFTWTDLTYGAGLFVAVGTSAGGKIAYSTNGTSWNVIALPSGTTNTWTSVSYGNGRFTALGSTLGKAVYSLDGITWKLSLYDIAGTHMAYGNGVFVTCGYSPNSTPTSFVSEDGIRWYTKQSTTNLAAIVYGINDTNNGIFLSVQGQGNASVIVAGAQAKARPKINGRQISEINEWDTGGNYGTAPTISIFDSNATVEASVIGFTGLGVLANPTFINRGTGYNTNTTSIKINGDGYADNFQTGLSIIIDTLTKLPAAGDNLAVQGNSTIYKITAAVALDGTTAPTVLARIDISPAMSVGLSPQNGTSVTVRTKYSQARLTNHDFLNIGYGNFEESNYPRLPTDTVISPQNETVEINYGRVFYSSTDQDGNFRVGELFAVEQATGIVTLSASQFGLTGLNELRLGGIAVGGNAVTITQFSTDSTFIANSNNIISTQKAIKAYLTARLSQGGANTFTGQLIAGTVLVGGPDRIASTVPNGNPGSVVRMPSKVNIQGFEGGGWDGNGMSMMFFQQTFAPPSNPETNW
jgi:hypothetical protein